MQGEARKGMKMPSELALFYTNRSFTIFGWLICHFDQKRGNCPVLKTPRRPNPATLKLSSPIRHLQIRLSGLDSELAKNGPSFEATIDVTIMRRHERLMVA